MPLPDINGSQTGARSTLKQPPPEKQNKTNTEMDMQCGMRQHIATWCPPSICSCYVEAQLE